MTFYNVPWSRPGVQLLLKAGCTEVLFSVGAREESLYVMIFRLIMQYVQTSERNTPPLAPEEAAQAVTGYVGAK